MAYKRLYGYGIVDCNGQPWWDESCVSEEPNCLREVCETLNDPVCNDPRFGPYRVVRLFWISSKRRKRK